MELRSKDPRAIKQWLLLALIAFEGGNAASALDQEQLPEEAGLRPRAGQQENLGQGKRVWTALRQEDYEIDFNNWLGAVTENSVAYAVTYLHSDTAQTNLIMKVGSDDQAKIFLNESEIYWQRNSREWMPDQDELSGVELKAGLNVLVFKVVNGTGGWAGSVRFVDAAGKPVNGLRVTLEPEAGKQ